MTKMVRTPARDENIVRKGLWCPEEDLKLVTYISKNGHANWSQLPKLAGLLRTGRCCKLRWMNYLSPDVKRGPYTQAEDEILIKLHEILGNRWSAIAARLPGRTDIDIKNRWNTRIKTVNNQDMTNEIKNHSHITNQSPAPSVDGWSEWLANCSGYSLSASDTTSESTINWFNEDVVDSPETFEKPTDNRQSLSELINHHSRSISTTSPTQDSTTSPTQDSSSNSMSTKR